MAAPQQVNPCGDCWVNDSGAVVLPVHVAVDALAEAALELGGDDNTATTEHMAVKA